MAYATWIDVENRFDRDLTDREKTQVTEWLDDVEDTILGRIPNLAALIAAGTLTQRTVVKVEANVVLRKLNNPQGKLTERIDDYSWTRDSSTATGALFLTDEDWAELTPSAPSDSYSIPVAYEPGWQTWAPAPGAWWAPS
jgi:hypothetical protein